MSLGWEAVAAYALALPDTELTTYYGGPAVKANGHPVVTPSREADVSGCISTRPRSRCSRRSTPTLSGRRRNYVGYPVVLVRYDSGNVEMVRDQIAASRDWAMARAKPKPRKG